MVFWSRLIEHFENIKSQFINIILHSDSINIRNYVAFWARFIKHFEKYKDSNANNITIYEAIF